MEAGCVRDSSYNDKTQFCLDAYAVSGSFNRQCYRNMNTSGSIIGTNDVRDCEFVSYLMEYPHSDIPFDLGTIRIGYKLSTSQYGAQTGVGLNQYAKGPFHAIGIFKYYLQNSSGDWNLVNSSDQQTKDYIGKLYGLKFQLISSPYSIIHDYRPALKDGVAGLHDVITNQFFSSIGTEQCLYD